jgi:hypothetical protein
MHDSLPERMSNSMRHELSRDFQGIRRRLLPVNLIYIQAVMEEGSGRGVVKHGVVKELMLRAHSQN